MKSFKLEILTPETPFFSGDCTSLVIPANDGMMGIMAGHTPLTAAIHNGYVSFTLPDGTKKICAVARGILSVNKSGARLLCDYAVLPENIDEEKENEEIKQAQLLLKEKQSRAEYITTQLTLAKAFNNLKIKQNNTNL